MTRAPIVLPPPQQTTIRVGPNEIVYKLEPGPFSIIEYRVAPLWEKYKIEMDR